MHQEIERKFLLKDDSYRRLATQVHHIRQGYLSLDPDRTVRVRQLDDEAFLTVKGRNAEGSVAHFEWEKPVSLSDAEALFPLCLNHLIDKHRYCVPWHELTVEVDVFHGDNEGLVLAEIELPREDYPLTLPAFIGEEVTHDARYYNARLSTCPYRQWHP